MQFDLRYFLEQLNLTLMIYKGLDWPLETTNLCTDIFNFLLFCPRLTLSLSSNNWSLGEKWRLVYSIYPETILGGPLLILSEFQTFSIRTRLCLHILS